MIDTDSVYDVQYVPPVIKGVGDALRQTYEIVERNDFAPLIRDIDQNDQSIDR